MCALVLLCSKPVNEILSAKHHHLQKSGSRNPDHAPFMDG